MKAFECPVSMEDPMQPAFEMFQRLKKGKKITHKNGASAQNFPLVIVCSSWVMPSVWN